MNRLRTIALASAVAFAACAPAEDGPADGDDVSEMDGGGEQEPALGPVDGHDLPPSDLDRVQVGDAAPDFTLVSLAGPPVRLSDFRGDKNVVLVFYRGYW
jgi:hypothetical protein